MTGRTRPAVQGLAGRGARRALAFGGRVGGGGRRRLACTVPLRQCTMRRLLPSDITLLKVSATGTQTCEPW
jgi:hypothetical protein